MKVALLGLLAAVVLTGCGANGSATKTVTVAAGSPAVFRTSTSSGPATSLQDQFVHVVDAVSPAVVLIATKVGLGSGVVYDGKGDIVTNAHVVGTAKTVTVSLSGGDQHQATVVGRFVQGDIAVVHLKDATPKPAAFGDSAKLDVGDIVLAMGNPLGLRSSVTQGIVSSLGRTVSEGNGVALPSVIQTSAAINPGNSGGALVNLNSEVIGIPTLTAIDPELGGAAPGIGFAISSNWVKRIADQLIANGKVVNSDRAYLGVKVTTPLGGKGVYVASVVAGGPAAGKLEAGDLIVAVDGKPTPSVDDLATVLAALKPGQSVPIAVVRGGKKTTVTVKLGELPGG
jgi:S1-C subfamily serine protease